jgi:cell division septation protein DedD
MAENRREKENRYYFSRGQMIILGGAFALASVVIFLIGMLVGKELEERKILKKEEPLVKIPVKPNAPGPGGNSAPKNDEITFYDTLSKNAGAQAPSQQKRKDAGTPEKSSKAEVKDPTATAKAESAAAKVADKKIDKVARPAEESKRAEKAENGEAKEQGRAWRAQVDAFPDERSAKRLVDRLKNKGYNNAYVTEAPFKGKTWYRVNVGKYASREEAEKVVETLKNKENQAKAFAASR